MNNLFRSNQLIYLDVYGNKKGLFAPYSFCFSRGARMVEGNPVRSPSYSWSRGHARSIITEFPISNAIYVWHHFFNGHGLRF